VVSSSLFRAHVIKAEATPSLLDPYETGDLNLQAALLMSLIFTLPSKPLSLLLKHPQTPKVTRISPSVIHSHHFLKRSFRYPVRFLDHPLDSPHFSFSESSPIPPNPPPSLLRLLLPRPMDSPSLVSDLSPWSGFLELPSQVLSWESRRPSLGLRIPSFSVPGSRSPLLWLLGDVPRRRSPAQ